MRSGCDQCHLWDDNAIPFRGAGFESTCDDSPPSPVGMCRACRAGDPALHNLPHMR